MSESNNNPVAGGLDTLAIDRMMATIEDVPVNCDKISQAKTSLMAVLLTVEEAKDLLVQQQGIIDAQKVSIEVLKDIIIKMATEK